MAGWEVLSCRQGAFWHLWGVSPLLLDALTTSLPYLLLLLSSPLLLTSATSTKYGGPWGWLNNLRAALALATLLLNVIFRLLLALSSSLCGPDLILLGVSFLSLILGIGSLLRVILLRHVTSKVQAFMWISVFLCNLPHFISGTNDSSSSELFILPLLLQLLSGLLITLQWFPYTNSAASSEDTSSFFQNLVFSSLSPLFQRGFRSKLGAENLPPLPRRLHLTSLTQPLRSSPTPSPSSGWTWAWADPCFKGLAAGCSRVLATGSSMTFFCSAVPSS